MTDIVERLREYAEDDHERGCAGRCYDCSCGYDSKRDRGGSMSDIIRTAINAWPGMETLEWALGADLILPIPQDVP